MALKESNKNRSKKILSESAEEFEFKPAYRHVPIRTQFTCVVVLALALTLISVF